MSKKIKSFLGIDRRSQYVNEFFYATNMRASVYMSIVVIVLEIFMIYSRIKGDENGSLTPAYIFENCQSFIIPLAAGIIMLTAAILFLCGIKLPVMAGSVIIWIFSAACIYFGMKTSYDDFNSGEQILTFLTMEIFVVCLLIWRPIIGIFMLLVSYGLFIYSIDGLENLSRTTEINMFIMWLATVLFCVSNYIKTLSQAEKDEQMENVNKYLTKVSVRDDLTGINNMVYFRNAAEKMLADPNVVNTGKVFLFFDIENFKSYNNKYGFEQGNELLKDFAGRILVEFPDSLSARYSDDHFVVFTSRENCKVKVLKLAAELLHMQGGVNLELKCGAYPPEDDLRDASLACDRARYACNSIKKHFGENFYEYDKKLAEKSRIQQYVVNNIDVAIEAGYIRVFYQPVVSTKTGGLCGLEALARWQDPEYGLLPPAMFIETLEEYRQIHKLDMCIIEQVCRDYREAIDNALPVVPVSLNFSRLDFELCDITGHLNAMAVKYRVPRSYLDVEITESALTDEGDFLRENMSVLRNAGHSLWLDDFGSGYSSLNVLKDYDFNVLKIDMLFLKGFEHNENTKTIIKVIVDMTKQLNMISLCEGVETKEQYEFLASIGCNRTQGYFFSKPVPMEEMRKKIESGILTISPEFLEAPPEEPVYEQEKTIVRSGSAEGVNINYMVERVDKMLIQKIIKDIDRGRSIQEIAKKHDIPVQLSSMICRMYLTHPGVDADGIMSRLGL